MNNADKAPRNFRDVLDQHPLASKIILAIVALILVLLIVLGVVMLTLVFFSVGEIEIRGSSPYSDGEILSVCGIKEGDRLYYLGADKKEEELLKKFPYLKSVEIAAYFPNKAVIKLESFSRVFVAEHESGYCYLNEDLKILEIITPEDQIDREATFLALSEKLGGEVGQTCEFDEKALLEKIYRELKSFEYFDEMERIDASDKLSISFVFSERYKIILGDSQKISEKLSLATRIYSSEEFTKDSFAIINVSDTKKAILRYVNEEDLSK